MNHPRYCLSTGLVFLAVLLSVQALAVHASTPDDIPGSTKVDAEQVIELAGTHDDLVIIDSRITDDRRQGYIEGSISLPDENTDCDALAIHLSGMQSAVLFYCNGPKCGRSGKAVNIALSCGYKNIYWFRGGFEEWKTKNYPYIKE